MTPASIIPTLSSRWNTLLLLERHDSIQESTVGESSPHRVECLQEGDNVSALRECECPEGRRCDEVRGNVPERYIEMSMRADSRCSSRTYQVRATFLLMSM